MLTCKLVMLWGKYIKTTNKWGDTSGVTLVCGLQLCRISFFFFLGGEPPWTDGEGGVGRKREKTDICHKHKFMNYTQS